MLVSEPTVSPLVYECPEAVASFAQRAAMGALSDSAAQIQQIGAGFQALVITAQQRQLAPESISRLEAILRDFRAVLRQLDEIQNAADEALSI